MASKTINEWERQNGVILPDITDPEAQMSEEDFKAAAGSGHKVLYDERIAWLQHNGYEVTRANMTDHTLATRVPAE